MTDRSANRRRIICSVQSVPVAQVQAEGTEHTLVLPLTRPVRRDDDVAVGDDLLAFGRLERLRTAIGESLYDVLPSTVIWLPSASGMFWPRFRWTSPSPRFCACSTKCQSGGTHSGSCSFDSTTRRPRGVSNRQ